MFVFCYEDIQQASTAIPKEGKRAISIEWCRGTDKNLATYMKDCIKRTLPVDCRKERDIHILKDNRYLLVYSMSTHLRILIAEDEEKIAESYRIVLKSSGHEVKITKDGQSCVDAYMEELKRIRQERKPANYSKDQQVYTPFDVVLMDYRMPVMDGMEAARRILTAVPGQRIVFASAYLKETLLDSLRHLNRIIELISKPFSLDQLVAVVEDEHLYKQLQKLNVDVERLKSWEPTHVQIYDLLNGLIKIRNLDPNLFKKTLNEQSVQGV